MRRWTLAALILLGACGGRPFRYDNSVFELAGGYTAKEMCSCLFVSQQSEDVCAELIRVRPDIGRFKVDYEAKEVQGRALGMGRRLARYEGEDFGCTLQPKE